MPLPQGLTPICYCHVHVLYKSNIPYLQLFVQPYSQQLKSVLLTNMQYVLLLLKLHRTYVPSSCGRKRASPFPFLRLFSPFSLSFSVLSLSFSLSPFCFFSLSRTEGEKCTPGPCRDMHVLYVQLMERKYGKSMNF
jgi:hypothetical protein